MQVVDNNIWTNTHNKKEREKSVCVVTLSSYPSPLKVQKEKWMLLILPSALIHQTPQVARISPIFPNLDKAGHLAS